MWMVLMVLVRGLVGRWLCVLPLLLRKGRHVIGRGTAGSAGGSKHRRSGEIDKATPVQW